MASAACMITSTQDAAAANDANALTHDTAMQSIPSEDNAGCHEFVRKHQACSR